MSSKASSKASSKKSKSRTSRPAAGDCCAELDRVRAHARDAKAPAAAAMPARKQFQNTPWQPYRSIYGEAPDIAPDVTPQVSQGALQQSLRACGTKERCQVQLIFDGQPKVRFCTGKEEGKVVPVKNHEEALKVSQAFCRCVTKKEGTREACATTATAAKSRSTSSRRSR